MSSLAIVRELVKMLMEVDADDEERQKRKRKMRKLTMPRANAVVIATSE